MVVLAHFASSAVSATPSHAADPVDLSSAVARVSDPVVQALILALAVCLVAAIKFARTGRQRARAAELAGRKLQLEIDGKKLTEGELRSSLEISGRMGRILDSTSNEIYVYDVEMLRFIQVNRGARENLAYSMEELRERTTLEIKPEIEEGDFLEIIMPLWMGQRDRLVFETIHRRKDGSTYPVEVRLQLSRAEAPPVFVEIVQDITGRRLLEAERAAYREHLEQQVALRTAELADTNQRLAKAAGAAEAASEAKSGFLANMSHELRTPLNAIIGITEMLIEDAEEGGRPEQLEPLRRVRKAGGHLLMLINDILDLSKIEAGKLTINPERFSIDDLIADLLSTVRHLAERNSNTLELDADGILGEMIADPLRMRQILFNLLSNACKFTQNGEVRIIAQRRMGPAGEEINIAVRDSGIGMTKVQMQRLFEAFMQADSSITRKYGGSGLGLAISRKLGQMMGGDVRVESEPGKGSTFLLTLPIDVRRNLGAPPPAPPALPQRKRARRIHMQDSPYSDLRRGGAGTP